MKCRTALALLAVVLIFGSLTASPQQQQNDYGVQSVAVVRQFVSFELQGGRLTPAGWRRAGNRFFVRPESESSKKEVRVVSDKFYLSLISLTRGPSTTVEASFPVCWGTIDSRLDFEFRGAGAPVEAQCSESYNLISWNQQWDIGPDGKVTPFAGTINREGMRIDNFPQYVTLSRTAAIRYVIEARDKSNDPVIRANANKTLAILKKLKE
ncbi:MAG: hypothetical protein WBD87_13565 [Candidatus Acidiferrales bacterium]